MLSSQHVLLPLHGLLSYVPSCMYSNNSGKHKMTQFMFEDTVGDGEFQSKLEGYLQDGWKVKHLISYTKRQMVCAMAILEMQSEIDECKQ